MGVGPELMQLFMSEVAGAIPGPSLAPEGTLAGENANAALGRTTPSARRPANRPTGTVVVRLNAAGFVEAAGPGAGRTEAGGHPGAPRSTAWIAVSEHVRARDPHAGTSAAVGFLSPPGG